MSAGRPPLRAALADYLELRRALGFKLVATERLLGQFVDHLEARNADNITIEDALAWAMLPVGAAGSWKAIRLSMVRCAVHLAGRDPSVQVPPRWLLPRGPDRATPYLYSADQIAALIQAAGALRPGLRAVTYQHLIGLLATTGLRVSEAIALYDEDLDAARSLLVVRDSKFGKTRLVPLDPSTVNALASYAGLRDAAMDRSCPALFTSSVGTRLHHSNINLTFNRLTEKAGITRRSASCRPRIHDMRHSFAVATVLDWYATGADVPAMLPRLSTYLGHTDPKHTYWYLSAAPELMAQASALLDTYLTAGRS